MNPLNEDLVVQQATADFLRDDLGWESVNAFSGEKFGTTGTLGRTSEHEVVLWRDVRDALERITPGLPSEAYDDAMRQLRETSAAETLLATNRRLYTLVRDGIDVSYRRSDGEEVQAHLRVVDFSAPENNRFLVVRELWIRGDLYRRRADLVGYVNGLPLVFIEVKNVHRDLRKAYEGNLRDYFDTIPHAFHFNAFLIVGNGIAAKVGTLGAKFEHFHEWKRLAEGERGIVDMDTLLRGLLAKDRLLDLVEHFILFDESGGGAAVKILARNHQVLGVNRAVEAVRTRMETEGKLGVFWHTQGSGKSYSMVFFAAKVRRVLGGAFRFVVLTDRDDLDGQIYGTFAGAGLVNNDRERVRATSADDLEDLLRQNTAFVFSLIQKFSKAPKKPYTLRNDVIVMTDEAHRSQYGKLGDNMRKALPNASYIGFTGTPLFKEDEITRRYFGDYVSTYDFQRAVEDSATVPLYYDARGERLGLSLGDLNERIAEVIEQAEIADQDVAERLEKELRREYHIITAEERLRGIARDFSRHYATSWQTGKAMLVCLDKITCVRMHGYIQEAWQRETEAVAKEIERATDEQQAQQLRRKLAWMQETDMAVVVSEEQGEVDRFRSAGLDIVPHRKRLKEGFLTGEGKRADAETAFKDRDHPFRVAIVTAMWLTGFDVPSLSTLYLDKPLKAHTLMQAIARANRVDEGKNNGLIVDYSGILRHLREALAKWASQPDSGHTDTQVDPVRPPEELIAELAEACAACEAFLTERGASLRAIMEGKGFTRIKAIVEAKEAANESDESRKRFGILAREVFKKRRACGTFPEAEAYAAQGDAVDLLYKTLQEDREAADISAIMRQLQAVVDEAITTRPVEVVGEEATLYDISKIDFERLRKEFERSPAKNTAVQSLKDLVERRLKRMMQQNPLRTDLQEHYERLVERYNAEKDRLTVEQTFEELLALVQELDEEESRAVQEGLSEEALAIYDLLRKPELSAAEAKQVKAVAVELLGRVRAMLAEIEAWSEKQATRAKVRQQVYDLLYADGGLPAPTYAEHEIDVRTEAVFAHFMRAYPDGPESPYYIMAA